MPVNTAYLSDQTTNLSNLSLNGANSANLLSGTVQVAGGLTASSGSLDLRSNTVVVSLDTRADSDGMSIGQLRLVFAASGISLVYSSGDTVYTVGASAVSAAQG